MVTLKETSAFQASQVREKTMWFPRDRRLRTVAVAERARDVAQAVNGLTDSLDGLDEHALFVALHTCAYRAIRRSRIRLVGSGERKEWLVRRKQIQSHLVQRNIGLVYHALRHFRMEPRDRDDFKAEGMMALVRAVDRFDPWRGVRFSTYAYNAITRAIARVRRRSDRYRQLFPITYPLEAAPEPVPRDDAWTELYVDRLRVALEQNLGDLTRRESVILQHRFPTGEKRRMTLEEIGADCGLSKERVRQIQNRALRKLRDVIAVDATLQ